MSDATLNAFVARGTTTQRLAFTPSIPTPASGPSQGYLWWDTDLQQEFAWNPGTAAWVKIVTAGPASMSVLTSGTGATYTVPAGIYRLRVRVQGPGGAGGSGDQSGAGSGAGAGGGAGGYAEKILSTTPGATLTYTVGVGGTAGSAGNNPGNAGSTATVFDSGGAPITGNVGSGGGSFAASTTLAAAAGGSGGSATGGALNITGGAGDQSINTATNVMRAGHGASTPLGQGGSYFSSGAGEAGQGYGSGGSGGSAFAGSSDVIGGAGANGVIIVEEFN